jgi:hypothetical protein
MSRNYSSENENLLQTNHWTKGWGKSKRVDGNRLFCLVLLAAEHRQT